MVGDFRGFSPDNAATASMLSPMGFSTHPVGVLGEYFYDDTIAQLGYGANQGVPGMTNPTVTGGASASTTIGTPPQISYYPHILDSIANVWASVSGRGTYQGQSIHGYSGAPGAPVSTASQFGLPTATASGQGPTIPAVPDLRGLIPWAVLALGVWIVLKLFKVVR